METGWKELAAGEIVEAKEEIRWSKIREESLKVAACGLPYVLSISNTTKSYGYHTTSSKFDCILKEYSIYLISMQKTFLFIL
jgi:hypothetical protein